MEKAPKTIKEFVSKMVEKVARVNEKQVENLIEKAKNTIDNVDKVKFGFKESSNYSVNRNRKIRTKKVYRFGSV
ncbi:unnamed protein product [Meloidogyne enterolobii]|uniref:Uncharacterized protein n=1 Tax=Meloidogyne enterolobii TaxID=390850 RepID=A0ACB0XWQ7_MELEN